MLDHVKYIAEQPQLPTANLSAPGTTVWMAGIEMGFWNFLATSLQAIGLERTTAVRSAFIIQVG